MWRNNALGIVPNSGDGEGRPPQRGATIENNLVVADKDARRVPGSGLAGLFFGGGIVIAGGSSNHVVGNHVIGQELAGILIVPLPGPTPWIPSGNVVWGNTLSGPAGSMDLAQSSGSGPNNCWTLNTFATTAPPLLEDIWSCGLPQTPPGGDPRGEAMLLAGLAEANGRDPLPWQTYPVPEGGLSQLSLADPACDSGGDCALEEWLPALGL